MSGVMFAKDGAHFLEPRLRRGVKCGIIKGEPYHFVSLAFNTVSIVIPRRKKDHSLQQYSG